MPNYRQQPIGYSKNNKARLIVIEVLGVMLVLWGLWQGVQWTARPIVVMVDGYVETIQTHRSQVATLLTDLDLDLQSQDRISLALDAPITSQMQIQIERAPRWRIQVDGRTREVASWGQSASEILADANVTVEIADQAFVDNEPVAMNAVLLSALTSSSVNDNTASAQTYDRGYAWQIEHPVTNHLHLQRAISIVIDDGTLPLPVRTTAQTVGEALRQAEVTVYLGDKVMPSLGSPVSTGLRVSIQRSRPLSVRVDGRLIKTRTQADTVAEALTQMGVSVIGQDVVEPLLATPIYNNIQIRVTRVHEDVEIEEEITPFETVFVPDPNILIDTQQVVNTGFDGIKRRRYRVQYEDGAEQSRLLEDSWLAQEPDQRVIAYGQNIVPRTATMPSGETITYWRKIRMSASSYSAGTAGVSPDAPWYGRTYTGERMRFGIVAVDPSVIPLRSDVYVPGYGYGEALDTGSAIKAKKIDLGYDDDNLVLWRQWVDVYVLWPPPPSYQITWVLPNWPQE
ncbi:MAG: ubiquitin-like domain-containing protein [Chloroflexota bacterium]